MIDAVGKRASACSVGDETSLRPSSARRRRGVPANGCAIPTIFVQRSSRRHRGSGRSDPTPADVRGTSARLTIPFPDSGAGRRAKKHRRCAEPSQADRRREQADGWVEMQSRLGLLQEVRRRKIVHERKRKHESEDDSDASRVDADRITGEILFQRHHDPTQRVDANEPKRARRDDQRDPEIDQRAADNDQRNEHDKEPIDPNVCGDRRRAEGGDRREPSRRERSVAAP